MKIDINHTEMFFLTRLARYSGILSALSLAQMRYKTSQQWDKKQRTYTKMLDSLCRRGFAVKVQGGYTITKAGRLRMSPGDAVARVRNAFQADQDGRGRQHLKLFSGEKA